MRKIIIKLVKSITRSILIAGSISVVIFLVFSALRGEYGNPSSWEILNMRSESRPFENSPERGRYALTTVIADHQSTEFTLDIAKYVVPDLGYINGKYVSLFAPGVSYLAVPLYKLGQIYGLAQVAAFSLSSVFAVFNFLFIILILRNLKVSWGASVVASMVFLFASVAWVYSGILYQHHITSTIILFSVYLLVTKTKPLTAFIIGLLLGLSFFVEYPNVVFFFPVLIILLYRHMELKIIDNNSYSILLKPSIFLGGLGLVIAIIPSLLYNKQAYGNYFQLAGTVQSVREISPEADSRPKISSVEKTTGSFFNLYSLPMSVDVLLTSKDRGVLWFSPVFFLSLLGIPPIWRKKKYFALLLLGLTGTILLLYGMWGDPWGGWAFGPRYLIPFFALSALFIGIALQNFGRKLWFIILFAPLYIYSVFVSVVGALTTIQLPPSVEIESAANYPKLIFLHNYKLIQSGKSGSFIYNSFFSDSISLESFTWLLILLVIILTGVFYWRFIIEKNENR
jgi:hypothetical protein